MVQKSLLSVNDVREVVIDHQKVINALKERIRLLELKIKGWQELAERLRQEKIVLMKQLDQKK